MNNSTINKCKKIAKAFKRGRSHLTCNEVMTLIGVGANNGKTSEQIASGFGGKFSTFVAGTGSPANLLKMKLIRKGQKIKHGNTAKNTYELTDEGEKVLEVLLK